MNRENKFPLPTAQNNLPITSPLGIFHNTALTGKRVERHAFSKTAISWWIILLFTRFLDAFLSFKLWIMSSLVKQTYVHIDRTAITKWFMASEIPQIPKYEYVIRSESSLVVLNSVWPKTSFHFKCLYFSLLGLPWSKTILIAIGSFHSWTFSASWKLSPCLGTNPPGSIRA